MFDFGETWKYFRSERVTKCLFILIGHDIYTYIYVWLLYAAIKTKGPLSVMLPRHKSSTNPLYRHKSSTDPLYAF